MRKIAGIVGGAEAGARPSDGWHPVVVLEELALRRWLSGDPSGFLEISADDVVYFDPFLPRRLNGKQQLQVHYEPLRGQVHAQRYEMLDPHVQEIGAAAVLTYNFVSYGGNENAMHWNCTEVYRFVGQDWRIVQTHWSFAKAG